MKFKTILSVAALSAIALFSSCKSDNAAAEKDKALENKATPPDAAPAPAPGTEPAQNAAGVWHYTCTNGCEGGAGTAIACAKCGTLLVHNSRYHTPPPGAETTGQTPNTPTPEPAQNALGVWHYTCPSGCAGGSGGAEPCAKCGKTLAHNNAYHNN
jgi:hypothetical protein